MDAITQFFTDYPWILAILPTIITGLAASPKTRNWAGLIKAIFAFLSVLTHRDQKGTFKLPFTAALPPKPTTTPSNPPPVPPDAT